MSIEKARADGHSNRIADGAKIMEDGETVCALYTGDDKSL